MNDREYLMKALNEAKKAYKKEEVPIGAIIVKDDKIIARAHNLRENKNSSLAHAEILCIEKACKKLKFKTPIQLELGLVFLDIYFVTLKFLARINASLVAAFPLYFL